MNKQGESLPFELDATMALASPRQSIRPATLVMSARSAALDTAMAPTQVPAPVVPLETWNITASALPRLSIARGVGRHAAASASPSDLELRGVLGEGGMGQVLLARQHSVGRDVAVKTLREQGIAEHRETLLREARITGALEHPGIIPVHLLGVDESGEPVLVMKRIEGTSWRALIDEPDHRLWPMLLPQLGGRDRLNAHLEILSQVCAALHFAHSKGVIHRDIKPDNVMVGTFGEVYLVDWGIAERLDQGELRILDGHLVGTPAYMAPEMISGRVGPLGAHTDVYLLGATLHEALTGSPRHLGNTMMGVLHAALMSAPVKYDDGVPDELATLCNAATSRAIEKRPQSALAFRQSLLDYLRHRGTSALIESAFERLDTLRAMVTQANETEVAQVRRLSIECRFAFTQAIQEWPENPRPREGLQGCLESLCSYELIRREAGSARALLDEMETPPASLIERLQALETELAKGRAEAEELQRQAREMDIRVGSGSRGVLALAVGLTGLTISMFMVPNRGQPITPAKLVWAEVGILVVLSIGTVLLRKQLLQNRISRRLIAVIFVVMLSILVHRVMAMVLDVSVPIMLIGDDLILASTIAGSAIGLHPTLAAPAGVFAAAAGLIAIFPERAIGIFVGSTILGLFTLAWMSFRYERSKNRAEQSAV